MPLLLGRGHMIWRQSLPPSLLPSQARSSLWPALPLLAIPLATPILGLPDIEAQCRLALTILLWHFCCCCRNALWHFYKVQHQPDEHRTDGMSSITGAVEPYSTFITLCQKDEHTVSAGLFWTGSSRIRL